MHTGKGEKNRDDNGLSYGPRWSLIGGGKWDGFAVELMRLALEATLIKANDNSRKLLRRLSFK